MPVLTDGVRPRVPVAIACAVVLFSFYARTASAQVIRAAALAPQFKSGASTPELRDKFHEAVVRGLGALNGPSGPNGELGEVLTGVDTRIKLGDELLTCGGQASCLPRALAALHVNRLISTDLTVIGKSYTISMRLYDAQARELTHTEDLCEICTVHEAEEAVAKQSARLAAAARAFPLETVPVPVEPVRPAPPVVHETPPPPPTSKASPMEPSPQGPPPVYASEKHSFPWRAVGFASFGLGIVGLAVGIPLVVIDGRPTCDAPDPRTQCKEVYSTAAGGGTMIALGAIGLVASVPLLYLDYRSRHHGASTAYLLRGGSVAGGTGLSFAGTF